MTVQGYFRLGIEGAKPDRTLTIETRKRVEDASLYRPAPGLREAVDSALILGRPLLLMGPPGTGKSELAYAVGDWFGWEVRQFDTKSTSEARDLFYNFDALSAFRDKTSPTQHAFITYQVLGRAIIDAFPRSNPYVTALIGVDAAKAEAVAEVPFKPIRTVVLIDEIDKAPRDFPNDLLNEIERLYFRVPELRNAVSPGGKHDPIPPALTPVVIITSNDERGLPQAFLRRCLRFEIKFPDDTEMAKIVARRMATILDRDADAPLELGLAELVKFFFAFRGNEESPSTAELLDWIQVLLNRGFDPKKPLEAQKDLLPLTRTVVAKTADAQTRFDRVYGSELGASQAR